MLIDKNKIRVVNILDLEGLPRNGDIRANVLAPAETIACHPFAFINSGKKLRQIYEARTKFAPPAIVFEIENCTLFGHGILVDNHGNCIFEHWISKFPEMGRFEADLNQKLFQSQGDSFMLAHGVAIREVDEEVAIVSQMGSGVYGHWLVDFIPRISLVESTGYSGRYALAKPLYPFVKQLLEHIGILDKRLLLFDPCKEALKFSKAIVPGPLRIQSAMSSLVIEAAKRLARNSIHAPQKKLYLSRGKWGVRQKFVNRAEIEALAVGFGYEIVHPEELNVSELALIFSQAAIVAGEYGSGMHNSIFAPASCRVLVFQSDVMEAFIQAGLSQAIGQPVGFVFGPANGDDIRTFSINPLHARQAFELLEGQ